MTRSSSPIRTVMARRSAMSSASHTAAARALRPQVELGRREVAQLAQDVVQLVGARGPPAVREALQLELQVGQDARVEELPQLLRPQQLPQQVPVERQRRGPPLGQRRVALVHVGGDPVEEQALRER